MRELERVLRAGSGFSVRVGEVLEAAASGRVLVKLDGVDLRLLLLRDYTPTVGDACLVLLRRGQGYVIGALGTAPPAPREPLSTDSTPPASASAKGSTVFAPTSVGTYRSGSWRDTRDLYQGDWTGRGQNRGAAFYGNGPRGLRGVDVSGVSVRLARLDGGSYSAQAPTLRLIAERARAGSPNYIDSTTGPALRPGEVRTFDLPTSWGDQLVAGTAGGVGIYVNAASPYIVLDGSRMTLRVDWTR